MHMAHGCNRRVCSRANYSWSARSPGSLVVRLYQWNMAADQPRHAQAECLVVHGLLQNTTDSFVRHGTFRRFHADR
jgi:hypothetical protein